MLCISMQKWTFNLFSHILSHKWSTRKSFLSIQLFTFFCLIHIFCYYIWIFFNLKVKQYLDRHNLHLPLQSKYRVRLPCNKKSNYQFKEEEDINFESKNKQETYLQFLLLKMAYCNGWYIFVNTRHFVKIVWYYELFIEMPNDIIEILEFDFQIIRNLIYV